MANYIIADLVWVTSLFFLSGCFQLQSIDDDTLSSFDEVQHLSSEVNEWSGKKGLTWGVVTYRDEFTVTRVGCHGKPEISENESCNAYEGDTPCSDSRPVLCVKDSILSRPAYFVEPGGGSLPDEFYNGWYSGIIKLSIPVRGVDLTSENVAHLICSEQFGEEYRMAEFHDGEYAVGMNGEYLAEETWPAIRSNGGWSFNAHGSISSESRFWIHINDKPANCWD